jgi:hypothetical protein
MADMITSSDEIQPKKDTMATTHEDSAADNKGMHYKNKPLLRH